MLKSEHNPTAWEKANIQNTFRLGAWTGGWLLTLALAAFGPKFLWAYATVPSIMGVILNLFVGLGMVLALKRHLLGMDEMNRQIFLDASALSLGVGLVCGHSYELLEDIKLIPFEPEISHLVILMTLSFMVGIINGKRKYR